MAMKLTTEAVKMRFPGVSNMSTDELLQLIRQESSKLLLLDVREEKEFQVSHLCKAHHINPSQKDLEKVVKLIDESGASIGEAVTVVCYCSLGYRSSALAQQLAYELDKPVHQELKSKTVIYNLEGSIFKWANEGKDLEDNKGRKTVYVHPYNIVWGKLLNAELRSSEPCESRQETAMQTSLTEAKM
ncbi:unnamed protein product [Porites lobata]|uniref:Rhodanese domain-containing protein n=1 Tax=Porites lobata TaxID=104759 RepID=A0ABN8NNR8_9CNID|nr:unnamed protein product [Porites lobata]